MREPSEVVPAILGRGLLSGLAGTALMTLGQSLEMKVSGREPSTTPLRGDRPHSSVSTVP